MSTQTSPCLPVQCGICLQAFDPSVLSHCMDCDEHHCPDCPVYGCLCTDEHPVIDQVRKELRAAALEFAPLKQQAFMMGVYSLTAEQRAKALLLVHVLPSLRCEVLRIDEERCGDEVEAEVEYNCEEREMMRLLGVGRMWSDGSLPV